VIGPAAPAIDLSSAVDRPTKVGLSSVRYRPWAWTICHPDRYRV